MQTSNRKKCFLRSDLKKEVKRTLGKLLLNTCHGDAFCTPSTPSSALSWKDSWDNSNDSFSSCHWENRSIFNLDKYVKKRIVNNPKWLESEFESLIQFDKELSRKQGLFCVARQYPKKNRFSSVLANEPSRVRFSNDESLYINANHIYGSCFNVKQNYVACQAPLPDCICDFWEMVFEQNSVVIVMLASEVNEMKRPSNEFDADPFSIHEKRRKVDQYWPNDNEKVVFGSIRVESKSTTYHQNDTLVIREFQLCKDGHQSHTIHLLQFYGWPDMDVPKITPFMNLLTRLDEYISRYSQMGPIILHCVAGVGRTGTLAAIHVVLTQLKNFMNSRNQFSSPHFRFNIRNIVQELKKARMGMVQEMDQYKFIYTTILEGCQRLGYEFSDFIPEMDIDDEFPSLGSSNSSNCSSLNSTDSSSFSLPQNNFQLPTVNEVVQESSNTPSTNIDTFHFPSPEPSHDHPNFSPRNGNYFTHLNV